MAIFQPTNITPSAFAGVGQGTVASADPVNISWQVNGNSPMTGYQIQIFQNNTASTLVYDSGKVTLATPFYGTDNRGNPVFFSYAPTNITWADLRLSDGNSYKLSITQFWGTDQSVKQYSASVFITRTAPTLTLNTVPATIDAISYTFSATYAQAQSDAINWCRWVLTSNGNTIEDTGEIETALVSYTYDGFLSGNTYEISCTVQTQSGITVETDLVSFSVFYGSDTAPTLITPTCMQDSSFFFNLGESTTIDGSATPSENYGSLANSELILNEGSSVEWSDGENDISLNITNPYSFVWKGDITLLQQKLEDADFSKVLGVEVLYDGQNAKYLFALGIESENIVIKTYTFNGVSLSYSSVIAVSSGSAVSGFYGLSVCAAENILSVYLYGEVWTCSISTNDGSLSTPVNLNVPTNVGNVQYAKFMPSWNVLIVGGTAKTVFYNVSDASVEQSYSEIKDASNNSIPSASIEFDQNKIFLGAFNSSDACIYIFDFNTLSFDLLYSYSPNVTGANKEFLCTNLALAIEPALPQSMVLFASIAYSWGSTIQEQLTNLTVEKLAFVFDYTTGTLSDPTSITTPSYSDLLNFSNANTWKISKNGMFFTDGLAMFSITYPKTNQNADLSFLWYLPNEQNPNYYSNPSAFYEIYDGTDTWVGIAYGDASLKCGVKKTAASTILSINQSPLLAVGNNGIACGSVSFPIMGDTAEIRIVPQGADILTFVWFWNRGTLATSAQQQISTNKAQPTITKITLNGYSKTQYIWIKTNQYIERPSQSGDPDFDEDTVFLATFDLSLSARYVLNPELSNFLYRLENGILRKIGMIPNVSFLIKDFGARSNQSYQYLIVQHGSGSMSTTYPLLKTEDVCMSLKAYVLIEATQDDQEPNVYHALNVWKFGSNANIGNVSNNNTPGWITNFTPYRLRQPTTRMGKSGTLSALLSNPTINGYQDTVQMQEDLYRASISSNVFFLKDPKGNLMMVHISSPITQTINNKTAVQEVSVSVPWEEVGDATNASIIQIETDEGWGNKNVNA